MVGTEPDNEAARRLCEWRNPRTEEPFVMYEFKL